MYGRIVVAFAALLFIVSVGILAVTRRAEIPKVPRAVTSTELGEIYYPGDMPILPENASVAIIGCARDASRYLPRMKEVLTSIRSIFHSSRVGIYENDSRDTTLDILKGWEASGFSYLLSEKTVTGNRTERLARGRNILMRWALEGGVSPPTYVIVLDMDDVNVKLTEEVVRRCFSVPGNWGMLGANQNKMYFDLWALRTFDDWMPFDCWACKRHKGESALAYCVHNRYRRIPSDADPFEVISCFGGFGLYKTAFILPRTPHYVGIGCEHVSFNEGIRENGGAIMIAPFLIND